MLGRSCNFVCTMPRNELVMTDSDHDRQRLLLPLETLRKTVPTTETQTYPNATLYPANQRQSRTLHPIRAARMGLRSRLRQLQLARRVPPLLAAPIQLASTTRQLEIPNTHPIPQYPAEQRGGFTQLDHLYRNQTSMLPIPRRVFMLRIMFSPDR